ncbi:MAG: hypothetical protein Q4E63_03235 [Prevotellaceae bacterium]|nr:hypothetical protein [Prevotellaceae bacterium]MDO4931655.1 hypothetical protein [Prevotellaceae bacterium]
MKNIVCTLLMTMASLYVQAQQSEWYPIATWPFVYELFQDATIYSGINKIKAKANIHVGKMSLWYESHGKRLEAKQGTVNKVTFSNGMTYYNINNKLCSVISEDTINGKLCRLYMAEQLDKPQYDEMVRINRQSTMNMLDFSPALTTIATGVADNEGIRDVEQEPLPLQNKFYMLYNDETFEVNESNILKQMHSREERNAYRAFVRSAEIIYSSKKSILTVWKTFFVK